MKETKVFINPFRIISPKLDREASRLAEHYDAPPVEMTNLEEGLLIMVSKLMDMTRLIRKSFIVPDAAKLKLVDELGAEVHEEEKALTGSLVSVPSADPEMLRALVLFPGRLERVGDFLESIANCSRIKSRDGIPFSDRAQAEMEQLFGLFGNILKNLRDSLSIKNEILLQHMQKQHEHLHQMAIDFALAHEDRLIEGLCSPKASSLYMDILDSIKSANQQIRSMGRSLLDIISA
jgi:Na+/phosphate symporter